MPIEITRLVYKSTPTSKSTTKDQEKKKTTYEDSACATIMRFDSNHIRKVGFEGVGRGWLKPILPANKYAIMVKGKHICDYSPVVRECREHAIARIA